MNRLEVKLHDVDLHDSTLGRHSLLQVLVDGAVLTNSAEPFTAGQDLIILEQCLDCGMCGLPSLAVRRHGNHVLWFEYYETWSNDSSFVPIEFFAFDRDQYEAALGTGFSGDLPEVSGAYVASLIARRGFPDWCQGLYTIPDLEGDPQGRVTLRELRESFITDTERLGVVADREPKLRLRIGLERPGTPEAIYEIGDSDGELAVKLVWLPHCPVWISGPALANWAAKILSIARHEGLA